MQSGGLHIGRDDERLLSFRNNIELMRYDRDRDQATQIGSGIVESGCKQYGLRLKRPGTRWSETGTNAMLALKKSVMNFRLPDFLNWHARQAVVAGQQIGIHPRTTYNLTARIALIVALHSTLATVGCRCFPTNFALRPGARQE